MNGGRHAARGQRAQGTEHRAEERLAANGLRRAAKTQGTETSLAGLASHAGLASLLQ